MDVYEVSNECKFLTRSTTTPLDMRGGRTRHVAVTK